MTEDLNYTAAIEEGSVGKLLLGLAYISVSAQQMVSGKDKGQLTTHQSVNSFFLSPSLNSLFSYSPCK